MPSVRTNWFGLSVLTYGLVYCLILVFPCNLVFPWLSVALSFSILRLSLFFSFSLFLNPDGPLARSLHHQPSSTCPHSHGNPQLTPQPPPQGDYVIPHTVTFHPPLPSHPSGHAVPPAPPPPLSTHHLSSSSAPLAQHLPTDHQTLPHHIPALGASVQRLHQHEMLQRMEVQRRRMMQHPTWVQPLFSY